MVESIKFNVAVAKIKEAGGGFKIHVVDAGGKFKAKEITRNIKDRIRRCGLSHNCQSKREKEYFHIGLRYSTIDRLLKDKEKN